VVLAAMKAYAGLEGVQELGCEVLSNLAINTENETAIAVAGGIPVVLAAMLAHTGHEGVQQQGCHALAHLAFKDDCQTLIEPQGPSLWC